MLLCQFCHPMSFFMLKRYPSSIFLCIHPLCLPVSLASWIEKIFGGWYCLEVLQATSGNFELWEGGIVEWVLLMTLLIWGKNFKGKVCISCRLFWDWGMVRWACHCLTLSWSAWLFLCRQHSNLFWHHSLSPYPGPRLSGKKKETH